MALYELRTYTLYVGKMAEATKLYQELGFPALERAAMTRSSSATSRPTLARSTNSFISGSLMTTPTGGSTGQSLRQQGPFVEGFASKFQPLVIALEMHFADGRAVGSTFVTAAASTYPRRCSRLPTR